MPLIVTDEDTNFLVQNINLARKVDQVPAMVYTPVMTEEGPRLMKGRDSFEVPENPLGDHVTIRDLIVSDYNTTASPVGVILVGLKGSGKTMLSEDLCNAILASGRPVLNVTKPIPGGVLSTLIDLIGPCAVLFDEFGKVYDDSEKRNTVLTLFSDSEKRNILFIVTANSEREFVDAMLNRPGRFKYRINYDGIKEKTVMDTISTKEHTPELLEYLRLYSTYHPISFDMLLLMKRLLKKCKTPQDFIDKIEFYNLPAKINVRYNVKSVTYGGSATDHKAWIDVQEDGTLILEVTKNDTGEVAHSQALNWTATEKVKRGNHWQLKIDDTFKVEVERDVSEHTFRAKERDHNSKAFNQGFRHPEDDVEYRNSEYKEAVKRF